MLVAGPAAVESFPRSALFFLPVSLPSLGSQLARSQLLGFTAVTAPAAAGGEGRGPSLQVRAESCWGGSVGEEGDPKHTSHASGSWTCSNFSFKVQTKPLVISSKNLAEQHFAGTVWQNTQHYDQRGAARGSASKLPKEMLASSADTHNFSP